MPVGDITRRTTNTNRLRRVDRWIAVQPALLHATDPFVVDLGYDASGVTTLELAARLAHVRPDVDVLGLEIDPARVRTAREQLARGPGWRRALPRRPPCREPGRGWPRGSRRTGSGSRAPATNSDVCRAGWASGHPDPAPPSRPLIVDHSAGEPT